MQRKISTDTFLGRECPFTVFAGTSIPGGNLENCYRNNKKISAPPSQTLKPRKIFTGFLQSHESHAKERFVLQNGATAPRERSRHKREESAEAGQDRRRLEGGESHVIEINAFILK